jgi:fatty-acyl-CoA synthase
MVQESAGAFMLFTSGSTGEPKAVLLTHRNVIDNIVVQVRHFNMVSTDRILVQLPLSHAGGVTELLVPGLMLGATLVLLERFHPMRALEYIAAEHITFVHQVPTMYVMMLELPDFAQYDLSSLRCVCVAGAPTPTDVMQRMMAMAPQVYTGYGMTEVAGFVTYTRVDDDADTICRTVGAIAPEFQLTVVDEHNHPVPKRTPGEVLIRGSCLMPCYYENSKATTESIDVEGWFHTGDIGWLDERGYLTLIGRRKLMYITGGYNVYPSEIEEFLSSHPDVTMAACVGVKDAVLGEVGAAFIVVRPGRKLDTESLLTHCRGGLADYKIPRHFHFRAELPLTSLGKIDRQALLREFQNT